MAKLFRKALLVHREVFEGQSRAQFRKVEELLRRKKISCKKRHAQLLLKEDIDGVDLVVVIGQDNAILKTCRYVKNQPVILMGFEKKQGDGTLAEFGIQEAGKLEEILNGNYAEKIRQRLEVRINSFPIQEPALNEAFFGSEKAYQIAEYEINYSSKSEVQKSSGVIVATGTGSTAWFSSAGGKEFNCQAEQACFIVREPYMRLENRPTILKGCFSADELTIIPKRAEMVLALDSNDPVHVEKGDKITFLLSKTPLKVLCPKDGSKGKNTTSG